MPKDKETEKKCAFDTELLAEESPNDPRRNGIFAIFLVLFRHSVLSLPHRKENTRTKTIAFIGGPSETNRILDTSNSSRSLPSVPRRGGVNMINLIELCEINANLRHCAGSGGILRIPRQWHMGQEGM
ncbi:hypothetical protein CDAR_441841 [Caerostris darwini]|uniref:Uncharacterized protein n=1 Tax=Caerostris darwini TaxID=1538125 RepID=A0AAV4W0N1_9ARAC|nr:hypothetical protein CDAR_441841 [Caerostris darwini]